MIDFCGIVIFLYSLCFLYKTGGFLYLILCSFLMTSYIIKTERLKDKLRQKEKIRKAHTNKQKEMFIEMLNHDIKVPILAQLRALQFIKTDLSGTYTNLHKEIFNQLENSCSSVLEMISMFSEVHIFEKKAYIPYYEKFNISELIISEFNNLSTLALEKNITFKYFSEKHADTYIEADKSQIKKVINNFLYNAINYSNNGKEINVTVSTDKEYLRLCISGFKFYKSHNGKNKRYTTVGHTLGMHLSKKIIEFHHGQIFMSDNNKDSNALSFIIPRIKFSTPQIKNQLYKHL